MKRSNNIFTEFRIEHLWAVTVMVGIFLFLNLQPIRPNDFWWHIAVGQDTWGSGHIPLVDTFSFTRLGESYLSYHQFWLMEVVLYLVYRLGGDILVVLTQTVMIFPAYLAYRLTSNWRAAALSIVFAFSLGFSNWNVRPQAISYLFGALVLWSITEFKRTQRKTWLLIIPITMALWVNSHGSFPIGMALVGIWGVHESWNVLLLRSRVGKWHFKPLLPAYLSLLFAVLMCLVNPRGFGFIGYLSMMAGNKIVQNFMLEWMPPTFNSLEGLIFFTMFLGSSVLLALSPRRPNVYQILTYLIFGALGLKYIRGSIWYGIVMAPVVAEHLSAVFDQLGVPSNSVSTPRTQRINRIFVGVLALLAFFSLPWFKSYWPVAPEKAGIIAAETPVDATRFMLEQGLKPQVFNDMAFGSYLMWSAQPGFKVFIDSRAELYPPQIWDDYVTISNAVYDWEDKLASYGINTLMLGKENQTLLIEAADASPNWVLVYEDSAAHIFTHR
jgi:hypothetical protein